MSSKPKHVINVPDDTYEWLRKIQAGIKFKYNRTVSQIQILLHISHDEIQSNDYDKTIDNLLSRMEKRDDQDIKKKVCSFE